jgi:predicted secreted protein
MSDETGSTPEERPTPPPYGEQSPDGPPPPPSPYAQQPPSPYGQQPPSPYGQQFSYGGPSGYGQIPPGGPTGGAPPNYILWSILTTVFCCLPFGIVSIVYAAQVNNKWAMGDVTGAHASSQKAKQFAIWSALTSVILTVLFIVLIVVLSAVGSSQS